jgi:hypothetical protein
MATKPTRLQELACDKLADALLLITEAARLDGRATLDAMTLIEIAVRVARASSAFSHETIVARALEARGKSLGLRSGTAELLTLLDTNIRPLEVLLLNDEDFRALVAKLEDELGDV